MKQSDRVDNRNWVQWNEKNVLESTIDNKIMGKMSPSKFPMLLSEKKTQNYTQTKHASRQHKNLFYIDILYLNIIGSMDF